MTQLNDDIRYLKGVGEQRGKLLNKLGINRIGDLLSYFPRTYEDRTLITAIADAHMDEYVCIKAVVAAPPTLARVRRGMELVKLRVFDESASLDITYFNQAYIRDHLKQGETYTFYGKIGGVPSRKSMVNPDYEKAGNEGKKTGLIMPKYPLCRGISNKLISDCIRSALSLAEGAFPNYLPEDISRRFGLAQAAYAYENIHFPTDFGALELARQRLVFEELFVLACALGSMRSARCSNSGTYIENRGFERFYSTLSFSPTSAQMKAIEQCACDMASGKQMSRLVQGDVGSGKTLVAAACIWSVCSMGMQAAFMAPTEILAEQHFSTVSAFLSPFGISVEKLTGSMSAKQKREVKARIASGQTQVIVGTHAIISDDVEFDRLALVVTDEQHRFGVAQRSSLSEKGSHPHVLVMSATPIPRTLALMIYGDLDVSIIDELPPGRQKVDTFTVDETYRQRLYAFIEKLTAEGRQVFVVCPMVEENDELDLELCSAVEHAESLKERFPHLRVACVHGKMKAKDKDAAMRQMSLGEIDVLVSTTVIEVGVDVPNAALMIVENAERFGLSQLHQLRGRVGRGSHKSYCVLVSDAKNEEAQTRLKAMCKTNDGFKISEGDLRLRGPGDFFGSRQHGLPEMHIASLGGDVKMLKQAQDAALELLAKDPQLNSPGCENLKERVGQLFILKNSTMN